MTKKKLFGGFMSIVSKALNLRDAEEDQMGEIGDEMPDLIKELHAGMIAAEDATTMTMALVGTKRVELKKLVLKQDSFKDNAVAMEKVGKSDLAKRFLAQALGLDSKIEQLLEQVQNLDQQASIEIANFRELETKADLLKNQIKEAEQLDRFNRIRERVSDASGKFSESVVAQIEAKVEKVHLKTAQLAAKAALGSGVNEDILLQQTADKLIADKSLDIAFKQLQHDVSTSEEALPEGEKIKVLEAPADKAKALLNAPAFDGRLIKP